VKDYIQDFSAEFHNCSDQSLFGKVIIKIKVAQFSETQRKFLLW